MDGHHHRLTTLHPNTTTNPTFSGRTCTCDAAAASLTASEIDTFPQHLPHTPPRHSRLHHYSAQGPNPSRLMDWLLTMTPRTSLAAVGANGDAFGGAGATLRRHGRCRRIEFASVPPSSGSDPANKKRTCSNWQHGRALHFAKYSQRQRTTTGSMNN